MIGYSVNRRPRKQVFSQADFTTSFPANESPISESSSWLNGLADGLDWQNVQTTNATDGIHRAVAPVFPGGFDDPTAIIKPSFRTFHNDQFAQGTIYRQAAYTPSLGTYHEAELRVRSTITAHSITGYEVLIALNDPSASQDGYAVVRWNGALGDFTTIYNGGGGSIVPVIVDLDVYRVEIRGSTLILLRNGVQLGSHDVTVGGTLPLIASGQPGMGFFPNTPGCTLDAFGWRSVTFGDLA